MEEGYLSVFGFIYDSKWNNQKTFLGMKGSYVNLHNNRRACRCGSCGMVALPQL